MIITRPAGRALSVGELRAAIDGLNDRDDVIVTVSGNALPVECITATIGTVEMDCGDRCVMDDDVLDLLARIARGDCSLRNARTEARDLLKSAGIEVEA